MTPAETYVRLRIREHMSREEAAQEAGFPDGPTEEACALYNRTVDAFERERHPVRRPATFLTPKHRRRLDELTAEDERWQTFAGHLFDPEAMEGTVCPEAMVEYVARRFVFTSRGRLFFLEEGGEAIERATGRGIFCIKYQGDRWRPTVKSTMRRMFPEVLVGEYDIDTDDERDWMEHLADRTEPDNAAVSKRLATEGELDFFGYTFES